LLVEAECRTDLAVRTSLEHTQRDGFALLGGQCRERPRELFAMRERVETVHDLGALVVHVVAKRHADAKAACRLDAACPVPLPYEVAGDPVQPPDCVSGLGAAEPVEAVERACERLG